MPKHKHNQINTSLWDPYLAKFITLTHITQMSSAGLKERTSCELWEFIPNGPVLPCPTTISHQTQTVVVCRRGFSPTTSCCRRRYRYGTMLKCEIYAKRNGRIFMEALGYPKLQCTGLCRHYICKQRISNDIKFLMKWKQRIKSFPYKRLLAFLSYNLIKVL